MSRKKKTGKTAEREHKKKFDSAVRDMLDGKPPKVRITTPDHSRTKVFKSKKREIEKSGFPDEYDLEEH